MNEKAKQGRWVINVKYGEGWLAMVSFYTICF